MEKNTNNVESQHYPQYSFFKVKGYKWYYYLTAFSLIMISYWGVTTNSDWGGYEYWFENDASGTDRAFQFLTIWFNEHGLTFRMLYRFHIILIALFYILLFRKLRVNPVFYTILMLLFNYVEMGNQIRYYVGFPMALLALYYYINKRFLLSVLFGVFAFFFHSSLALFFAIFFLFYYCFNGFNNKGKIILVIGANIVLYYLVHNTDVIGNFEVYLLDRSRISSLLGGLFNLMPTIIYIYFTYLIDNEIRKCLPDMVQMKDYKYLYICIMMGTVLFLCSIPTQILAHRMMGMILMPIWLTYFIRVKSLGSKKINNLANNCLIVLLLFYTLNAFGVFTGSNDYFYHIKEMLDSYTLS